MTSVRSKDGNLPVGSDTQFTSVMMPTFRDWLGVQEDPWDVSPDAIVSELNRIWANVRPQDKFTVVAGSDEFPFVSSLSRDVKVESSNGFLPVPSVLFPLEAGYRTRGARGGGELHHNKVCRSASTRLIRSPDSWGEY